MPLHGLHLVAPDEEVVQELAMREPALGGQHADRHDPFPLGERHDGAQQVVLENPEHPDRDRDCDRHRQPAHEREPRVFPEYPEPELHVEPGDAEPSPGGGS
jgi:hypothetical protein